MSAFDQLVRDDAQLRRDMAALERWRAGEGHRLAAQAAALRKQADTHEALAREAKAAGDKRTHNTIMLMVNNMRLQALLAERHVDWKLGQRRRRDLERFAAKGAEKAKATATKYTAAQRQRWQQMYATTYAGLSKRSAAARIVSKLKLPTEAVETVRKAL
jgi:hypothetical protein